MNNRSESPTARATRRCSKLVSGDAPTERLNDRQQELRDQQCQYGHRYTDNEQESDSAIVAIHDNILQQTTGVAVPLWPPQEAEAKRTVPWWPSVPSTSSPTTRVERVNMTIDVRQRQCDHRYNESPVDTGTTTMDRQSQYDHRSPSTRADSVMMTIGINLPESQESGKQF
jgi:hypothetical protein